MVSKAIYALTIVGVIGCGTLDALAASNSAEQAYRQANQLVAQGDLVAAHESLKAAVRMDRANQKYLQQYMLVYTAVKLQKSFETERDLQRWQQHAQSLSLFYASQGLHAQALPIDKAIYQKLGTTDAAVQLAETHLEVGNSQEAVEVLNHLNAQQATVASCALLGVALARQGDVPQAEEVVGSLATLTSTDPFTLYLIARAQAAVGHDGQSLATLTRCYEAVPPSRLSDLKAHTQSCQDFAGLVKQASFTSVLQTQSKVAESKCSGGSSCSSCPMRGNCSHGQ